MRGVAHDLLSRTHVDCQCEKNMRCFGVLKPGTWIVTHPDEVLVSTHDEDRFFHSDFF